MSQANTSNTVELIFSRDESLYYVTRFDHHRPKSWVSVNPNEDGKYKVLPFAFYEVKSGKWEMRPESDELVQRYAEAEGWPKRESVEWRQGIAQSRSHAEGRRAEHAKSVEFWESEIARLDALIDAAPLSPPSTGA